MVSVNPFYSFWRPDHGFSCPDLQEPTCTGRRGRARAMEGRFSGATNGGTTTGKPLLAGHVDLFGESHLMEDVALEAPPSVHLPSSLEVPPAFSNDKIGGTATSLNIDSHESLSLLPTTQRSDGDYDDDEHGCPLRLLKRDARQGSNDESSESPKAPGATSNTSIAKPRSSCNSLLDWIEDDNDSCKCSPATCRVCIFQFVECR